MSNDRLYMFCRCGERTLLFKYYPSGSYAWEPDAASDFLTEHVISCSGDVYCISDGQFTLLCESELSQRERGGMSGAEMSLAILDLECINDRLKQDRDRLVGFIERQGYRRCDIPACNCGSFHGGDAHARLREIYEALGGCQGTLPVPEIQKLQQDNERLRVALVGLHETAAPFALYQTAVSEYGSNPVATVGNQALTGYAFKFLRESFDKAGEALGADSAKERRSGNERRRDANNDNH